jgi:hypothetical protein
MWQRVCVFNAFCLLDYFDLVCLCAYNIAGARGGQWYDWHDRLQEISAPKGVSYASKRITVATPKD